MSVIEVRQVSFSYGPHRVLEDVNLSVPQGDFACLVGPNGGGKTTLLKLLLGLLEPDAGSIRVLGRSPREARRRIGYMPQHARLDPLFPATVLDVVLMGRLGAGRTLGGYSRRDYHLAREALHQVALADLAHRSFAALSGGQQQRVLIARALAGQPDILMLDEPTSSLDMSVEQELYDLLQRLNQRLTILLVSHDLGFVSQFVKTVICVNRRVVAHPTSSLSGEMINQLYGAAMHMVRHDHEPAGGDLSHHV
ncbi:ABC transporter ATP-binding protein [bacterium]|nr:ABC transporter ATP-binding protein [bacterium]